MSTETKGTSQREHPTKTWWDCYEGNMKSFGLSRDNAKGKNKNQIRE